MHAHALRVGLLYGKRPAPETPVDPMGVSFPNGGESGGEIFALFPPGAPAANERVLHFSDQGINYEVSRAVTATSPQVKCTVTIKMTVPVE